MADSSHRIRPEGANSNLEVSDLLRPFNEILDSFRQIASTGQAPTRSRGNHRGATGDTLGGTMQRVLSPHPAPITEAPHGALATLSRDPAEMARLQAVIDAATAALAEIDSPVLPRPKGQEALLERDTWGWQAPSGATLDGTIAPGAPLETLFLSLGLAPTTPERETEIEPLGVPDQEVSSAAPESRQVALSPTPRRLSLGGPKVGRHLAEAAVVTLMITASGWLLAQTAQEKAAVALVTAPVLAPPTQVAASSPIVRVLETELANYPANTYPEASGQQAFAALLEEFAAARSLDEIVAASQDATRLGGRWTTLTATTSAGQELLAGQLHALHALAALDGLDLNNISTQYPAAVPPLQQAMREIDAASAKLSDQTLVSTLRPALSQIRAVTTPLALERLGERLVLLADRAKGASTLGDLRALGVRSFSARIAAEDTSRLLPGEGKTALEARHLAGAIGAVASWRNIGDEETDRWRTATSGLRTHLMALGLPTDAANTADRLAGTSR